MQVDVVLSVEQRIDAHTIQEKLPHLLFLGPERLAGVGQIPFPSIASVKRTMLNTMSSFSPRAHDRMFSASSRFCEKIVVEMPKLKLNFFCSSASRGSSRWPC